MPPLMLCISQGEYAMMMEGPLWASASAMAFRV